MNREDIIRMAREQGLPETATEGVFIVNTDDLGRILAAEREACAKVVDDNAKQCGTLMRQVLESNAAAIRARGNT
jgi:hypothetical protein